MKLKLNERECEKRSTWLSEASKTSRSSQMQHKGESDGQIVPSIQRRSRLAELAFERAYNSV